MQLAVPEPIKSETDFEARNRTTLFRKSADQEYGGLES